MPNRTLITGMEAALKATRSGESNAVDLADTLRQNSRALELLPYTCIQEIESLAMDLEMAQWHDEDGFAPNWNKLLQRVEKWIVSLPVVHSA